MKYNNKTLEQVITEENEYIRSWGGILNIPEANNELNNYQREKMQAMKEQYGQCYIINLWRDEIQTEYTGQTIYNFAGDWIVNKSDNNLIELIQRIRDKGYDGDLFMKITDYIYNELKGIVLCWS